MDFKIVLVTVFLCHWANGYNDHIGDYPNQPHRYFHVDYPPFHDHPGHRHPYHEKKLENKSPDEDFANVFDIWHFRPNRPDDSGGKLENCTGKCAEDLIRAIFKDAPEKQDPPGLRFKNPWITHETTKPIIAPSPLPLSPSTIADCIRRCPVTSEYSPVCGTDNVTYGNLGRLMCATNCGVQVKLSRATACSAPVIPNPIPTEVDTNGSGLVKPINNSQTSTAYPKTNKDIGNKDNSVNQGTNNIPVIKRENDKPNGVNSHNASGNVNNRIGNENGVNNGGNCLEGKTKNPPSLEKVMACMQLCPLTSDYNPVCGTDGITYMNPGRLLCSQFCGVDVRVNKFCACSSDAISNNFNNSPIPAENPVNNKPEEVTENPTQICLKMCFVPDDITPVCGTNRITYKNLGSLKCARRCGIEVEIVHTGACDVDAGTNVSPNVQQTMNMPVSLEECLKQCPIGEKYKPLCGTDNITYYNTENFVCARRCGADVEIKELSPCSNQIVLPLPLRPPVQEGTVTPSPDGLDYISADVLNNIFTNKPPPSESDADEDIKIDPRIKEETDENSANDTKKLIRTITAPAYWV